MGFHQNILRIGIGLAALGLGLWALPGAAQAALNIPLTVNMSETVTVDTTGGTPRIPVDVGGNTRYAAYTSGSGSNTLTFTLTPTVGDVDLDGVSVSSPVDLNGGTIKDSAGNNATLTFTPPNTSGIKVDYPSLSMDFINNDYLLSGTHYNTLTSFLTAAGGSFTRSSVGTYFDNSGVLQTASTDTPRFDYDPVTHSAKGIFLEESKINYLLQSGNLANAVWTALNASKSNGFASPDGLSNATKVVEDTTTNVHHIKQNYTRPDSTTVTMSMFAKAAGRQYVALQGKKNDGSTYPVGVFNLTSGTLSATANGVLYTSIASVGNGWYRCSVTFDTGVGGGTGIVFAILHNGVTGTYTGDGSSGVYVWGLQLENGSIPTSYIPTTTAAVTRSADSLSLPIGGWYGASAGTLYTNFTPTDYTTAYRQIISASGADATSDRVSLAYSNNRGRSEIAASGILSVNGLSISNALSAGAAHKLALAYGNRSNIASLSGDGGLTSGNGGGTGAFVAPAATILQVGDRPANHAPLDGWVSLFRYYPETVANSQLQLLTQ